MSLFSSRCKTGRSKSLASCSQSSTPQQSSGYTQLSPAPSRTSRLGRRLRSALTQVDQERFNAGLALFRRDQFRAARDEWQRADSAQSDPKTQFYIAYSFYREGWGRVYHDQDLFKKGVEAVNREIALSPAPLTITD